MPLLLPLAQGNEMEERTKTIIVKEITFDEASPAEAFKLIRQKAKASDPKGTGVNFIYRLKKKKAAFHRHTLTADLRNVSVYDLVRHVCIATGLDYLMEQHAILIVDGQANAMQTRTVDLSAGVIDANRTRSKAGKIK